MRATTSGAPPWSAVLPCTLQALLYPRSTACRISGESALPDHRVTRSIPPLGITRGALIGFRGAYAPMLSEKRGSFLRLLKNKGFKEESMTKVGLYAIGQSTTLESNKSLSALETAVIYCGMQDVFLRAERLNGSCCA